MIDEFLNKKNHRPDRTLIGVYSGIRRRSGILTDEHAAKETAIVKLSHRRDPPDCSEDPGLRPTRVRRIHTLSCPRRYVRLIVHGQDDAAFQLD